jgi:putative DNA methylase
MSRTKLIETWFPLQEINVFAEFDMAFQIGSRELRGRVDNLLGLKTKALRPPRINNLMYYPARIPPSASRAVTLASVLDDRLDAREAFLRAVGLDNAMDLARKSGVLVTLYMVDPDRVLVRRLLGRDPREITVIDPMAGGGSIPLEALRLGFRTVAGDYNPLAYLILRATIEFPAKYGRKLVEILEHEARELVKYAREELGRYYNENDKEYIFFIASEHDCGGLVPLAKHTLLSRRGDIHVKPVFSQDSKHLYFQIGTGSPVFSTSICPYCGRPMSEGSVRDAWVKNHVKLLEELLDGREGAAEKVARTYILASVQLGRGRYRVAEDRDTRLLIEAARELARSAAMEKEEGRSIMEYIPLSEIPDDNNVFRRLKRYGIRYWYQLFNPRQLLALYKLTKYIRGRAEHLKKIYGELGVAVALYLALAIVKMINYNNILTQWHPGSEVIRDITGRYALGRKVDLGYDYCEGIVPFRGLPWTLEAGDESDEDSDDELDEIEATRGGILPVVRLLSNRLDGLWKDGLDSIFLWDARELEKHFPEGSVDLINVDPPYYDQHDYLGITEFFWVVVQQVLWNVLEDLFPRERIKISGWHPEYPEIPRGVEIRGSPSKGSSVSEFASGFKAFLQSASKVLKDDGLLVVWYAYGRLEGWEELFRLFYETGYGVTKTWQVWSQSSQRRIALQTSAFFTSMVIIARPRAKRATLISYSDPLFIEDVRKTVETSMRNLVEMYGLDALKEALVVSLADGFSRATFYSVPSGLGVYQIMAAKALEASVHAVLNYLARDIAGIGDLDINRLDPLSRLYTFLLIASSTDDRRAGGLKISYDFANKVEQVLRSGYLSMLRTSADRGVLKLLSPIEVSKKFNRSRVGEGIALLITLREIYMRHGLKAAEDIAMNSDREAVSLARLLVAVAWDNLGLGVEDRELLLKIMSMG